MGGGEGGVQLDGDTARNSAGVLQSKEMLLHTELEELEEGKHM